MNTESLDTISCPKCGADLPPTAEICGICGAELLRVPGPTVSESEPTQASSGKDEFVPKPEPDELPPNIRQAEILLALVVILVGIILNLAVFAPDRQGIALGWKNEYRQALLDREGDNWHLESQWPPQQPVTIVIDIEPDNGFYGLEQDLVLVSGIPGEDLVWSNLRHITPSQFEVVREDNQEAHWLYIHGTNSWSRLSLEVSYWSPGLPSLPAFYFRRVSLPTTLYWRPLVVFAISLAVAGLVRHRLVERYRRRRQQAYEEFEKKRTEKMFAARTQVENARQLVQSGEIAKALVTVNNVLKAMPGFIEAVELKKQLLLTSEAGTGSLVISPEAIDRTATSAGDPTVLYLRVLGTPYAYQAPPGKQVISIGRQRVKPGDSQQIGNDVVIRVPGSDQESLRISRRHLEIHRINNEYFVIDKSQGNTRHNGKELPTERPVRLQSGDRLQFAGTITLQVLIRFKMIGQKTNNVLQITSSGEHENRFLIEATIGDMLTEIGDE